MASALRDQVAVVTGASSGIGRAIALALAAEGVALGLVSRSLPAIEEVAAEARLSTRCVRSYPTDLTLDEDIHSLAESVGRDYGGVDILVHSAGVVSIGPMASASVADLDWQYRTNVRAPYALTQALLPLLTPRRAQIVFINSSAGMVARANVAQYAATKHALKAIADSLREEVNCRGLRVLTVYPGRTASRMQAAVHEMEGRAYHPERLMRPDDVAAVVIRALSLPRTAEVTDIQIRPMVKSA